MRVYKGILLKAGGVTSRPSPVALRAEGIDTPSLHTWTVVWPKGQESDLGPWRSVQQWNHLELVRMKDLRPQPRQMEPESACSQGPQVIPCTELRSPTLDDTVGGGGDISSPGFRQQNPCETHSLLSPSWSNTWCCVKDPGRRGRSLQETSSDQTYHPHVNSDLERDSDPRVPYSLASFWEDLKSKNQCYACHSWEKIYIPNTQKPERKWRKKSSEPPNPHSKCHVNLKFLQVTHLRASSEMTYSYFSINS